MTDELGAADAYAEQYRRYLIGEPVTNYAPDYRVPEEVSGVIPSLSQTTVRVLAICDLGDAFERAHGVVERRRIERAVCLTYDLGQRLMSPVRIDGRSVAARRARGR